MGTIFYPSKDSVLQDYPRLAYEEAHAGTSGDSRAVLAHGVLERLAARVGIPSGCRLHILIGQRLGNASCDWAVSGPRADVVEGLKNMFGNCIGESAMLDYDEKMKRPGGYAITDSDGHPIPELTTTGGRIVVGGCAFHDRLKLLVGVPDWCARVFQRDQEPEHSREAGDVQRPRGLCCDRESLDSAEQERPRRGNVQGMQVR